MNSLSVGILGAGIMGRQLALLFAANGYSVKIWNRRNQANFDKNFERLSLVNARLGLINKDDLPQIITRVKYVNELSCMDECEIILEAIKEDAGIKKSVFKDLNQICLNAKVIATNTSTLSITELSKNLDRPQRFIGLHFFNPPLTMKLVEVIKGKQTSDEALDFCMGIIGTLGKHGVILPDIPGFVVNRLLLPMINEAVYILSDEVVDEKTIDNCMRFGANHPMGPLELADLIGLDVCLSILEALLSATNNSKYKPAPLLEKYVMSGRLGKKTGIGFYTYANRS